MQEDCLGWRHAGGGGPVPISVLVAFTVTLPLPLSLSLPGTRRVVSCLPPVSVSVCRMERQQFVVLSYKASFRVSVGLTGTVELRFSQGGPLLLSQPCNQGCEVKPLVHTGEQIRWFSAGNPHHHHHPCRPPGRPLPSRPPAALLPTAYFLCCPERTPEQMRSIAK